MAALIFAENPTDVGVKLEGHMTETELCLCLGLFKVFIWSVPGFENLSAPFKNNFSENKLRLFDGLNKKRKKAVASLKNPT